MGSGRSTAMTWTLGEAETNAAAIVKEFTDTFYTPPAFNVKALTNRIAGAIRRAEEEAAHVGRAETIRRAEEAARAAGRREGMDGAAEFIAGFIEANKENEPTVVIVARELEQGLDSGAKRNGIKRSGFGRLFQVRRG